MYEWNKTIQNMVNIIDKCIYNRASDEVVLDMLSQELGYSKFHITRKFSEITKIKFRDYLRYRKLSFTVIELRDSDKRIIDIALDYGFLSQEAFTRAFKNVYGITPRKYRISRIPLKLQIKQNTFDPYFLGIGESSILKKELEKVTIAKITLPEHNFIHVKSENAKGYWDFWEIIDNTHGMKCDTIAGQLDSISGKLDSISKRVGEFDGQIGGYFYAENGKKGYAYGIRLPKNYDLQIPKQMLCLDTPQTDYIVFSHSPFDYEVIGQSVVDTVENEAYTFDYQNNGYTIDKTKITYQMHDPTHIGYRLYVPITRIL